MRTTVTLACRTDIIRQFRHYLVQHDVPEIAFRFENSVEATLRDLSKHPQMGKPTRIRSKGLVRRWPISGFDQLLIYYRVDDGGILFLRILHGKRKSPRVM